MANAKLVPELICSNLQASLQFYEQLIGFSILYDRPEDGFAYLNLDGACLMLEQESSERLWQTGKLEKPYGRGMNFQIEVSNVDIIHDRLIDSDWPLFLSMEEKWYRKDEHKVGNRQFLVQDPDGYLLRFFKDLGERP